MSPEHRDAQSTSGAAESTGESPLDKLTGMLGIGSAEQAGDSVLPNASEEAMVGETTTATTTIDLNDARLDDRFQPVCGW